MTPQETDKYGDSNFSQRYMIFVNNSDLEKMVKMMETTTGGRRRKRTKKSKKRMSKSSKRRKYK